MKKLLAFLLVLILAAAGYLGYTYYPLYRNYNDMKEVVSFSGDFKVKADELAALKEENGSGLPDGALKLLEFLEKGSFDGEYVDGIAHAYLYKDGTETAIVEVYYSEDQGLLINLGQIMSWGLEVYGSKLGVFYSWLADQLKPYMNMYVSYDQIAELVAESGDRELEEGDGGAAGLLAAYMPTDLKSALALMKELNVKTCQVENKAGEVVNGLSMQLDKTEIPAVVNARFCKYPENLDKPVLPEAVTLSDDQMELMKTVIGYFKK